jgi:hypothetical protein
MLRPHPTQNKLEVEEATGGETIDAKIRPIPI